MRGEGQLREACQFHMFSKSYRDVDDIPNLYLYQKLLDQANDQRLVVPVGDILIHGQRHPAPDEEILSRI